MVSGSCHCGKVKFEVEGAPAEAMECNCSHCGRKGFLLWFVPRAHLRSGTPVDALSSYRFNRHVIDHRFCPDCGCAPFSLGTAPDGAETAAINIRCLEGIDLSAVKRIAIDGRSF
ncbi:MAG: GFA family protein [Aquamicrobium sp.]|uniref:GFA family protein n=1 Tax=Aquamicrobium sp. TaxID=1872579 RepID=UPI00349ED063|nr:GFA family protein [Aquamicrobium sp.]